jgi:hypothetical protein
MFAYMLKWIIRSLAGPVWRIQWEARVEGIEARLSALTDRFNRFQSREGMRQAREAKTGDQTLEDQVKAILSDPGASEGPKLVHPKADLYRRLRR